MITSESVTAIEQSEDEDSAESSRSIPEGVSAPSHPLTIHPELESALPPLSAEERRELRDSILNTGIRDNLLAWRTVNENGEEVRILVDGHNRLSIVRELGLDLSDLPMSEVQFESLADAKAWIIANQLMRRNLTDEQRAYFRGQAYTAMKKAQGGTGANQYTVQSGQNDQSGNTAQKLAKRFGVSEKTIRRDAAYSNKVDSLPVENKAAVLSGKMKLPKTEKPVEPAPKHITNSSESSTDPWDVLKAFPLSNLNEVFDMLGCAIERAEGFAKGLETVGRKEVADVNKHCRNLKEWINGLEALIDEHSEAAQSGDF